MQVQSYLFFDGRCEEALEFYKRAVGAEVTMLMRNARAPSRRRRACCRPAARTRSCTRSSRSGDTELMASDGHCKGKPHFEGVSLALSVPDDASARKRFDALAAGGNVDMPLTKDVLLVQLRHAARQVRRGLDGDGDDDLTRARRRRCAS
jgi:PhnB protein